ncbi:hypothetical protein [Bradyrhizobium zhanjiangense]|uniref:hypothetical protein n=1 Tax=Bradyrhizobium zhanjiangense TaxID=1325107 RepID=UPI001008A92F|nr:hypothetical protein [Bradyrhizobium zhanjiangense]
MTTFAALQTLRRDRERMRTPSMVSDDARKGGSFTLGEGPYDETAASHPRYALSRRSLVKSAAGLLRIPFAAKATNAWAQEKLAGSGEGVVFSYGGSFTEGVRRYVYEPFTKATGIRSMWCQRRRRAPG